MLGRKRQIMFEVLGRRGRSSRVPERVVAEAAAVPRVPRRRAARKRERPASPAASTASTASAGLRGGTTWWIALGSVVLVAVVFVAYRVNRSTGPKAPVLQVNTEQQPAATPAAPPERPRHEAPAHTYAVCAFSQDYRNKIERKLAADKVQEAVDFCYRADPDFRDVRGVDHPGKDPNTGTFRVYVGSAASRSELVPLKEKLGAVIWNRSRPFQHASVRMIERAVASPGQGSDR
jgi:hypothetical protein